MSSSTAKDSCGVASVSQYLWLRPRTDKPHRIDIREGSRCDDQLISCSHEMTNKLPSGSSYSGPPSCHNFKFRLHRCVRHALGHLSCSAVPMSIYPSIYPGANTQVHVYARIHTSAELLQPSSACRHAPMVMRV